MSAIRTISDIYDTLLKEYGPQGWWPLLSTGYHKGNYSYPKTANQRFEICVGAILTQNTAWKNVEKTLYALHALRALEGKKILELDMDTLKEAIRPAGYFNQKARKLKEFARFYLGLKGKAPARKELLAVWGIGPETADSILLYAYNEPQFVVDAYTRRILLNLKMIEDDMSYDNVKQLFESQLKSDATLFQEYHALLVEHAKRYYSNKSDYRLCPLYKSFS